MIENNLLTYNDAQTVSGLALSRGFKKISDQTTI